MDKKRGKLGSNQARKVGITSGKRILSKPLKFSFTIKGVSKFNRNMKIILRNSESLIYKAVDLSCKMLATEASRICLSGPYEAYDTGKLARSMKAMVEKYTLDYISGVAGSFGVDYAIYVHEGTRYMIPRPFLIIAIKRKQKVITNIIQRAFKKELGKGLVQ